MTEVAHLSVRHPYPADVRRLPSMAALMHPNKESTAISSPLPGTSTLISSHSEPYTSQQPRPDSNLSSIASAGLHISRSGEPLSHMSTASLPGPMDRSLDQRDQQNSSQVAREALGASERSQARDSMSMSERMQIDSHPEPGNLGDTFDTTDHNHSSLINTSTVASPGPIEDSTSQDGDRSHQREGEAADAGNKAFSYPMPAANFNDPRRGLSLPDSGLHRAGQRSPSSKKHRCPYCTTEFTRHHNLKSHLLTHSHEKPFECKTCHSRFRRLHDLKRHSKLHTGERPHICPKCGRRFARGDALARHNKGQGGCAGRRASMGSFAAEDEYADGAPLGGPEGTMEGLVYAEPERMDEEDERRLNMPGVRHDVPPGLPRSNTMAFQTRQSSTYPPIAASKPSGGLFPPAASHGGSSASASPMSQTGNMTFPPTGHQSGASVLHAPNAESSKPPSPNAFSHPPGHVPDSNLHPHLQQGSLGKTGSGNSQAPMANHAGPSLNLPPPQPGAPQLPPPPGMSSPDSRFALQSSTQLPHSGAVRNHSGSSKTSVETGPGLPGLHDTNHDSGREERLWAYIRSVHDELAGLKTEVAALKTQLASSNSGAPLATDQGTTQRQGAADGPNPEQG